MRRVVDHAHDSFTIGDQMNFKGILACLAMSALLAASTATPAIADVDANAGGAPARVENAPKEAAKAEAVARKVEGNNAGSVRHSGFRMLEHFILGDRHECLWRVALQADR